LKGMGTLGSTPGLQNPNFQVPNPKEVPNTTLQTP
jgi:hypothetical protein